MALSEHTHTTMLSDRSQHRFALFLVGYELTVYLSLDAYLPALSAIAHHFAHSGWSITYTVTSWFLGTTATQLFMGPLTERFGFRRTLLFGLVLFTLANAVCIFTHNMTTFLLARFAQGACVGAVVVPGYGIIHSTLNQKAAIRTIAWMSAICVLGPAVGPLLGASILSATQAWQAIFAVLLASGVLHGIGLFYHTPQHTQPTGDTPAESPHRWRTVFATYGRVLTAKAYARVKIGQCCLFACIIAWIANSAIILTHDYHFTPQQFAWNQALVFGAFILGTKSVKYLLHCWRPLVYLRGTIALGVLSSIVTVILTQWFAHLNPWYFITSVAGIGMSAGMSLSALDRLTLDCSTEPMAMRVAIGSFLFSGFGFIGSATATYFSLQPIHQLAWLLCALMCLGTLLIFSRQPPAHLDALAT